MNIGIYFETSKNQGGAYSQNLKIIEIFQKNFSKSYNFIYIVPNEEQKKIVESKGEKSIILKKNLRFKIEQFFFRFSFFKEIYKKLSLNNYFENFLLKNNVDLVFFNSPIEQVLLINKINFVIMLLSMQHYTHPVFPEYKEGHDIDIRNDIINHAVKKSFKIFVGAEKDKELLTKFFNADQNKIIVQSYLFTLPDIYKKNINLNYTEIYEKLNLPKEKNILIYPAQFWAHKNHRYILDIILEIKNKNNFEELFFVFSGFDKGNLGYIKRIIFENHLQKYVKVFDFIDDYQLISLYKNSFGVIMPTYIGHSTIPMYECFFFKKNIFYTKDLSDKNLQYYLTEIDIDNTNSFFSKYEFLKKNNIENEKRLDEAFKFFETHCDEKHIIKNFSDVFDKFKKIKKTWS